MKNATKGAVTNGVGTMISVSAPIAATLSRFPLWVESGSEQVVSGAALLMCLVCAVPLFKSVKGKLKNPSAFVMWGLLFALLGGLRPIIDDLYMIAFTGVVSNGGGFLLHKLGDRIAEKADVTTTDGATVQEV